MQNKIIRNPANLPRLSVFTILLALIGNGVLIPRALFIRDQMWFVLTYQISYFFTLSLSFYHDASCRALFCLFLCYRSIGSSWGSSVQGLGILLSMYMWVFWTGLFFPFFPAFKTCKQFMHCCLGFFASLHMISALRRFEASCMLKCWVEMNCKLG